MTVKLDETMRRAKKGKFASSELEVKVYAQRELWKDRPRTRLVEQLRLRRIPICGRES